MQETHYGRKKKRMMAPPTKKKRRGGKTKKGAKAMSREDRIKMGEDALGDQPF